MSDIPAHILEQVHLLAAEGLPVGRMSFLLRLSPQVIEEELRHPTVQVNTTGEDQGSAEELNDATHKNE